MTNFVRLRDVDYILDTLVDSQKQMLILGIYIRLCHTSRKYETKGYEDEVKVIL